MDNNSTQKEERDLTWKLLDSKYLLRDTWATIRLDTCEKPDGHIITPYYVYEFPNWVTAVAFTKDGLVILERQYRHALGKTIIEIPGGCIEPGEAHQDAIARELLEETGYTFEKYEYLGWTTANPSTNSNVMYMYLATGGELTHGQHLDAGEDLEVVLVSLEKLKEMLLAGEFVQSMHATAIFHALLKLGHLCTDKAR